LAKVARVSRKFRDYLGIAGFSAETGGGGDRADYATPEFRCGNGSVNSAEYRSNTIAIPSCIISLQFVRCIEITNQMTAGLSLAGIDNEIRRENGSAEQWKWPQIVTYLSMGKFNWAEVSASLMRSSAFAIFYANIYFLITYPLHAEKNVTGHTLNYLNNFNKLVK